MERLQNPPTGLGDVAISKLKSEAIAILSRCTDPTAPSGQTTGLVLGQVQSGKTMSFTTLAALARDNGYRIVVVITGSKVHLMNQSVERLQKDLALDRLGRRWKHIAVLPNQPINRTEMRDALEAWDAPPDPLGPPKTLLVTVMKHGSHIHKLRTQIESLRSLVGRAPAMIIDDEADQASLNTHVKKGGESPTYRELLALKRSLPHHTYVQYTATPQALLLINVIGVLSPTFCEVLEPGDGYTGGAAFFEADSPLVEEIPPSQIGSAQAPLIDPPECLERAMKLFFLGVAAGLQGWEGGHRSMLVHPSVGRNDHAQYHQWILDAKESWKRLLREAKEDADRTELISEFRAAYRELQTTVPMIPAFEVLEERLSTAVRDTLVEEVNTRKGATPHIQWSRGYSWILVGGNAMDRGFTVQGLTITYMPRGLGGGGQGNADTVQQRARFFGYKRRYLGYCRAFLEGGVLQAFRSYVEHEQDVRQRVASHRASGRPLSEWPRAFLLDAAMRPTRDTVIDVGWTRQAIGSGWFRIDSPHLVEEVIASNCRVIQNFRDTCDWKEDVGHPSRSEMTKHLVARRIPLRLVHERLLVQLQFPDFEESQTYLTHLVLLGRLLDEKPDALATIYLMSKGVERERAVDKNDRIVNLFQGAMPVSPKSQQGSIYAGDLRLRDEAVVTVQLHNVRLVKAGVPVAQGVPTIAISMPAGLNADLVIQPQGVRRSP